ncbi:glycosyltransferase [Methylosinus sp. LW4]|uniref:glycosyltransferase n=1 Tax=Methylosinus sp. LW4 TaxID=136993 RepID=UPI0018DED10C|nr:glycosyltransferase [Methylosinus sp. LW4]
MQEILAQSGVASDIYAEHVDERLTDKIKSIFELRPDHDDLLIVHHSMGHDIFPFIRDLQCRKILQYHNITPPIFFARQSPFRYYAKLGLSMLSEYRKIVDAAFADSDYNAAELQKRNFSGVDVIPLLRDFTDIRWRDHDPRPYYFESPRYQLLFVGRICPNKGQMHLIRFMSAYRDSFDYPLHLTLVGHSDHGEDYASRLEREVDELGLKSRIHIVGHVPEEALYGYYRAADAYVSYSEHEGFGVPLLEAMAFDTPVLAYNTSAISSTLGNSGVLLRSTDPEELASALHRLFENPEERRLLIRGQRAWLKNFSRPTVAKKFMNFIEPHLPRGVDPYQPQNEPEEHGAERVFVFEGPCETTYSLALVNRNLALALNAREHVAARLVPAEGLPGYTLKSDAVEAFPQIEPLLKTPPFCVNSTEISVRNMYPLRAAGMLGDFRLSYFFWEESEIPSALAALINRYLDGIIAPTHFVLNLCRNSGVRIPIQVCGVGLDHRTGVICNSRAEGSPFWFGHISSGMARKGIDELITAYAIAFKATDNVELIIKTHHNVSNIIQDIIQRVIVGRVNAPYVRVIYDDLNDEDIGQFYSMIDAIVLPTRGEGYNLPAAEAMASGVPVIVTAYSGHIDFCDSENAYLVDFHVESSSSHVNEAGAMWVRADVADLAKKMRLLFDSKGDSTMSKKIDAASKTVAPLTWARSAENVEAFVDKLTQRKLLQRKMRVGWVSTWNVECGIYTYSNFLIDHLPPGWFDVTIFANHEHTIGIDGANVHRLWTHREETLDRVVAAAIERNLDIVVFQYNYGFHKLVDLANAVAQLEDAGISVHVFFHKTQDALIDGRIESISHVTSQLRYATRLVVHSVDDVERLKSFGLVNNVVKLPHGAFRPQPVDRASIRAMLGLSTFNPVIATYGFLLPGKGLPEIILAFAQLLGKYPAAILIMVNSLYGKNAVSQQELALCKNLVAGLHIEDKVIIIPDFLDDSDSMTLLQAADVSVFGYQQTGESASGAIRYGLSALRPVVTTPQSIFQDVVDFSHQARGCGASDIADAISEVLENAELRERLLDRQRAWLDEHDWSNVAERFSNMAIGLFEDRHSVRVIKTRNKAEETPSSKSTSDDIRTSVVASGNHDLNVSVNESRLKDNVEVDNSLWYKNVSYKELDEKSDEEFIRALYVELLEREPEEAGAAGWLHDLTSHRLSRSEILQAFLRSSEFLTRNKPIVVSSQAEDYSSCE